MDRPQRIGDYPFDVTYMNFDESKYEDFLEVKRSEMMNRFQTLLESVGNAVCRTPELDIIRSPPRNCRQKCRFAIRRKEDLGMAVGLGDELVHAMWDEGRPTVVVEAFPIASMQIYNMMPVLLSVIQSSSRFACMVNGFASVHYLSTLSGALIVTMNYDATNADSFQDEVDGNKCTWRIAAEQLREELRSLSIASITSLSLIGRARGAKVVVGEDCVIETLHLADGRSLSYKQVEEGFSNPNAVVNQGALGWLCAVAQEAVSTPSSVASSGTGSASCSGDPTTKSVATAPEVEARRVDLLEMYCGNGNHTVALAAYFNQVMGVEINPALCAAATENFAINGITNAKVVVCDSGRFATQILRTKRYILYAPVEKEEVLTERNDAAHASVSTSASSDSGSGPIVYSNKSTAQLRANKSGQRQHRQPVVSTTSKKSKVPLYEFNFGAVLVDPPRCGLDALTLSLVASYDHVIYISCCPDSLMRDLTELLKTHWIQRLALFDQFAYTPHIETGVWLRARAAAETHHVA